MYSSENLKNPISSYVPNLAKKLNKSDPKLAIKNLKIRKNDLISSPNQVHPIKHKIEEPKKVNLKQIKINFYHIFQINHIKKFPSKNFL